MIVNWNEDRVLVIPVIKNGSAVEKDLTILPGMNDVEDEIWGLARTHVKQEIKTKLLVEMKGEVEESTDPETKVVSIKITSKTLKEIPAREAEEIVKQTFSLITLNKWLTEDPRDSVRTEIRNQIDAVNKYGEETAKKKADSKKE